MSRAPLAVLAESPHTTTGSVEVNRSGSSKEAAQVLGCIVERLEISRRPIDGLGFR